MTYPASRVTFDLPRKIGKRTLSDFSRKIKGNSACRIIGDYNNKKHMKGTFKTKIISAQRLSSTCGFYIINRKLHGLLEIRIFSSSVEKKFTSERSEQVKYF